MPRVQNYTRQIEPAPLPGVRQSPVRTTQVEAPLLRVNPDTGAEKLGNTLARIGEATYGEAQRQSAEERLRQQQAMALAQKQQDEERVAVAEHDFVGQQQIRTDDPQIGWFYTRKGDDARGLPDEGKKFSNELYDRISKGLNPRQQQMFAEKAFRHQDNFDLAVMKYTAGEIQTAETKNSAALVDLEIRGLVAGAHDPHRIADGVVAVDKELQRFGDSHGETQPTIDDKKAKAHSDLWEGVIRRLMVDSQDPKNPMRDMSLPFAKAYFEAHGDEIEVNKRNELKTRLDVTVNESSAAQYAVAAFKDNGPQNDAAPLEMDKILAPLQKKFATSDPTLYKAIKTQVEDLGKTFTASVKARKDFNEGSVWKAMADGAPLNQITAMPEFQALDGKEQNTVKEHVIDRGNTLDLRARSAQEFIENKGYREETRAYTREQHAEAQAEKDAWAKTADILEHPETLAKMTDAEIYSHYKTLGRPQTNALIAKRKELQVSGKITKTKIYDAMLMSEAKANGLDLTLKSNKSLKGALQTYVTERFAAAAKPGGGELGLDEQQEIIDKAVMDVVLAPGVTIAGHEFFATKKRAFNVQINDVPVADQTRIRALLPNATPAEIVEQFIFEQQQGAPKQPKPTPGLMRFD